jgi:hypothetical protein
VCRICGPRIAPLKFRRLFRCEFSFAEFSRRRTLSALCWSRPAALGCLLIEHHIRILTVHMRKPLTRTAREKERSEEDNPFSFAHGPMPKRPKPNCTATLEKPARRSLKIADLESAPMMRHGPGGIERNGRSIINNGQRAYR